MIRRHAVTAGLGLLLYIINVAAFWFLFLPGEAPYRDSIEGGYASMARFFHDNPSPWGWNPEWYLGLPAQFTYLPGLPYLAALWMNLLPWLEPYHVYRIVSMAVACLVPVSLYLMIVYFSGSRVWGFAVALAYTFCCPLYDLFDTLNRDRGLGYLPWRLQVLRKYGEGPHNMGLALIPLVLMASWRAGLTRGFGPVFAAAVLMAAVALTNWVASLALAFCGLLLLAASAGEAGFRQRRVVGAAALGYGLACFWLTPTFIWTTAFNWPTDAFKYAMTDIQKVLLGGVVVGVLILWSLMRAAAAERRYLAFLVMGLFVFGWIVMWFYDGGVAVIPEGRRYALEFELFLFLMVAELVRMGLASRRRIDRAATLLVVLMLGWQGQKLVRRYFGQDFARVRPAPAESTIERRLARKLAELRPAGRVLVTGGLRFRLNSWFPLQQVGGGFESGLRNRRPLHMDYQIRTGLNMTPEAAGPYAVELLRTMGVEYVVVHGPKSREHYKDFRDPAKFEGLLEVVYREEDDVVYRVPEVRMASLVRAEDRLVWPDWALPSVTRYLAGAEAVEFQWLNSREFEVRGRVAEGKTLSVLVPYEDGWAAWQDGKPLAVSADGFQFLNVQPEASQGSRITFRYRGTPEQRAMGLLSVCVWVWAVWRWVRDRRCQTRV